MSLAADVRIPRIYMSIYKLQLSSFRKINVCMHIYIALKKTMNLKPGSKKEEKKEKKNK